MFILSLTEYKGGVKERRARETMGRGGRQRTKRLKEWRERTRYRGKG